MDVVRKQQSKSLTKAKVLISVLIVSACLITYFIFASSNSRYLVERDALLVDNVQQGEFNLTIRGTGFLVSSDIRWIANRVSGRVERLLIKAGAEVKQGDLLMELSNPQLEQALEETHWQLQELEAQTQSDLVALESELLDQEAEVISQQLDHEKALITLNAQDTLLKQGASSVSEIDHQEAKIQVTQLKKRWRLAEQRLNKKKQSVEAQKVALKARLERNRRMLARAEQQVKDLQIRASMDSIVQEMPMELGQQVAIGTNLAKLARKDQYIAELRIPEKQIRDVVIGHAVTIDTRNSHIAGEVIRIDPAVTNNTVQVDVALSGEMPKEARPDLTIEGEIAVANIEDTLFVKRPAFAKGNSGGSVYRLEGDIAVKVPVRYGRMSSQYIQIIDGLNAGEKIIVSDASLWQQHEQIKIN